MNATIRAATIVCFAALVLSLPEGARAQGTPVVDFSATPLSGCGPLEVQFQDATQGLDLVTWIWDFGDGGSSLEQNPSHTYTAPGSYTVQLIVNNEASVSDSETKANYITVNAPVSPEFDAGPLSGCAPHQVSFVDLSTGDGVDAWTWDFGDGQASAEQNPTHTYTSPGLYTVRLTVEGTCGLQTRVRNSYVEVLQPSAASFTTNGVEGCAPFQVKFTDGSTGTGLDTWLWDFGDGQTSTEQSPSHTFTAPGIYTITLSVSGVCGGDVEVRSGLIHVLAGPNASFSADVTSGCAPLSVKFTDGSSGAGLSAWQWDFGDGGTSPTRSPTHSYTTPGTYTVKLTASGTCGSDTSTRAGYIVVQGGATANFTASVTSGCPGLKVDFTDTSTSPTGISARSWDFGDGGTSAQQSPSHTYANPGQYTVKLTVTDACGQVTKTATGLITVKTPPRADFQVTNGAGCAPLAVEFKDVSTGSGVSAWAWDFGDGGTSSSQSPSHAYAAPGEYTVALRVTGDCGADTSTRQKVIKVTGPPTAGFNAVPDDTCAAKPVLFQDTSSGAGLAWAWDFGDGAKSNNQSPSHTFAKGGAYKVRLTVTSACGSDSEEKTVTVRDPPVADFVVNGTFGCAPFAVKFTDQSRGDGLTSWSWSFGDGGSSSVRSPDHTFDKPGTFEVKLTVANECGSDSETKTALIAVLAPPTAAFSADHTVGCVPFEVRFSDESGSEEITAWSWDFGDGSAPSSEERPTHTYTSPGRFSVRLRVSNRCGEDDLTQVDYVVVGGAPAMPGTIDYARTGFQRDAHPVSWPAVEDADQYVVEGRVGPAGEWFVACDVAHVPDLPVQSCEVLLTRIGIWTLRVKAISECGDSDPREGPTLEVLPPQLFARWPLDGCSAPDVEKGNDGVIRGTLDCTDSRFGLARSSLGFSGSGFVEGTTLPPWSGDFTVSLWTLPSSRAPAQGADPVETLLQISPRSDLPAAGTLTIAWDRSLSAFRASHGNGVITSRPFVAAWHHVAVSRTGGALTLFVDGSDQGAAPDILGLGEGFSFGMSRDGTAPFVGLLDDIQYESRKRDAKAIRDLILQPGGTAILAERSPATELSSRPGASVPVLGLRLDLGSAGNPAGPTVADLALTLTDLDGAPPPEDSGLGFIESLVLYLAPSCDGAAGDGAAADRVELGRYELPAQTSAELLLSLSVPETPPALPPQGSVCLVLEAVFAQEALPRARNLRFAVVKPEDLILVSEGASLFILGRREPELPAVAGNTVHVVNDPPALTLALPAVIDPVEQRGPIEQALLHEIDIQAGPTENIRLEGLTYRAKKGAKLAGLTNAVLYADAGQGPVEVARGTVSPDEGRIAFEDLLSAGGPFEVKASTLRKLILRADLDPAAAKAAKSAGSGQGAGAPIAASVRLPPGSGRILLLAVALVSLLCLLALSVSPLVRVAGSSGWTRLRLATAALLVSTSLVGATGCGPVLIGAAVGIAVAGSSGGGGSGSSFSATYQVSLAEADVQALGTTSGIPPVLESKGNLDGPKYVLKP